MTKKRLDHDEMKMLELLMARYAATQPMPMTSDEAWAEFCAGKCSFTITEDGIGVAPVRGAARFSAARRHKMKFKALQEARKLASLKHDDQK